jgi:glycosyltransferase involved in cell wall biosynthesis
VFVDWFLPGYKAGGPIRSVANLTEQLSAEFDFFIVTSNTDYSESKPYPEIKPDCWTDFADGIRIFYFSKSFLKIRNIKKLIKNTDFDSVYINGIYSFYFSILPQILFRKSKQKIITASRGMLSEQAFSAKNFKKKMFIAATRIFSLYKNTIFHSTDSKEEAELNSLKLKCKGIETVPNLTRKLKQKEFRIGDKQIGILKMVSIARISPEKNTLFALEILGEFQYFGTIEFDIFGSVYNENYWAECQKVIRKLPQNIKVNYKGNIESSKVEETFSQYHLAFMPSVGENFGHSIIESLSAGCPVLIGNNTPWQNLETEGIGFEFPLSEKQKFTDAVKFFLNADSETLNGMSKKAYQFAGKVMNDSEILTKTKKLFL